MEMGSGIMDWLQDLWWNSAQDCEAYYIVGLQYICYLAKPLNTVTIVIHRKRLFQFLV